MGKYTKIILRFMLKNKWFFLFTLLIGVSFYWFQWRPSQIKKGCYKYSVSKAEDLIKKKSEMSSLDYNTRIQYREAVEKGLHLKDDENSAYSDCLAEHGL